MNISERIRKINSIPDTLPHISQESAYLDSDVVFPDEIITEKLDELSETLREPLERQIEAVESIAGSAEKTANKADIKGWIAVIISGVTLILEICDRLGLF